MGNSFTLSFCSLTFLLQPGNFFSPLGANVEDPFKSPAVPLKEFVTPAMGCFEMLSRISTEYSSFFPCDMAPFPVSPHFPCAISYKKSKYLSLNC